MTTMHAHTIQPLMLSTRKTRTFGVIGRCTNNTRDYYSGVRLISYIVFLFEQYTIGLTRKRNWHGYRFNLTFKRVENPHEHIHRIQESIRPANLKLLRTWGTRIRWSYFENFLAIAWSKLLRSLVSRVSRVLEEPYTYTTIAVTYIGGS